VKVRLAQLEIPVNQAVRSQDRQVLEGVKAQSGLRDLQVRYTLLSILCCHLVVSVIVGNV